MQALAYLAIWAPTTRLPDHREGISQVQTSIKAMGIKRTRPPHLQYVFFFCGKRKLSLMPIALFQAK